MIQGEEFLVTALINTSTTDMLHGESAVTRLLEKEKAICQANFERFKKEHVTPYDKYEASLKESFDTQEITRYFYSRAFVTVGTITKSEEIETEDGTCFSITFEYSDNKENRIEYQKSFSLHWVSKSDEKWKRFIRAIELGRSIIVFYDPCETHKFMYRFPQ